jgi:sugar phosphate isomerase/epimerase
VGLRPVAATPTEVHFPLLADAALRRETLARMQDLGIGLLDIEILRLKPQTVVTDFEPVLAFGATFAARFALVAGNDPDLVRTADNLAALSELARKYQIVPHIEFMPWTNVPNLATALQIVSDSHSDNAGLLVDAFHFNRSGSRLEDIPIHDSRFGYVQLCDIAGPIPHDMNEILHEARSERLFPGQGDCNLIGLLQCLPSDLPISLEVPSDTLRRNGVSAEECALRAITAMTKVLRHA